MQSQIIVFVDDSMFLARSKENQIKIIKKLESATNDEGLRINENKKGYMDEEQKRQYTKLKVTAENSNR